MSNFVPNGLIYLMKDVDIDSSYTHQYYFANTDAQWTFFESKISKTLTNGTYQRKNKNTISVPYLMDEIADCNYLAWRNPEGTYTKTYFAFITSIDYENPKTSIIHYELDVYQTYLFDIEWKQSFIEREHCDRWRTVSNLIYPVVNTEPEGLDYGTEYKIVSKTKFEQIPNVSWMVLGVTKFTSALIPQVAAQIPTGIYYLAIPFCIDQQDDYIFYNGASETYQFVSPGLLLKEFATNTTLVNSLVSCIVTPFLPFDITYTVDTSGSKPKYHLTMEFPGNVIPVTSSSSTYVFSIGSGLYSTSHDVLHYIEYNDTNDIYYNLRGLYTESKLLMYPYSFMELTNERGNAMTFKMEYVNGTGTGNLTIGAFGTLNYQNKALYVLKNYLSTTINYVKENGLNDNSNNSVPIINDYTASFIQSNSNALEVANSNANITLQNALNNAQRTYNSSVAGILGNAGGSILDLGIEGSGVKGSQGISNAQDVNNYLLDFWNSSGAGDTSIGRLVSGLGDFITGSGTSTYRNAVNSANTNYQTTTASILAKKQDAQQIPPTVASMGGDFMFNIINDSNSIYLLRKTIMPEYANKLQDYFKQYGYKVNKLETPQFHTRASWNYIKMAEPNVYGNIPMDDLMAIRGIFLKGITLWHGDYVGDYTRNNDEI